MGRETNKLEFEVGKAAIRWRVKRRRWSSRTALARWCSVGATLGKADSRLTGQGSGLGLPCWWAGGTLEERNRWDILLLEKLECEELRSLQVHWKDKSTMDTSLRAQAITKWNPKQTWLLLQSSAHQLPELTMVRMWVSLYDYISICQSILLNQHVHVTHD